MKKTILSTVFVLTIATLANAAPRFGVIGEQDAGIGAFITDDMYNAQLTFYTHDSKIDNSPQSETQITSIKVGGNYKIALDSVTALTAGLSYQMISGKESNDDFDSNTTLAIVAGFERELSSKITMTVDMDLYSMKTSAKKSATSIETKENGLFSAAAVGIAYLF
jgi:hypothetical protein